MEVVSILDGEDNLREKKQNIRSSPHFIDFGTRGVMEISRLHTAFLCNGMIIL